MFFLNPRDSIIAHVLYSFDALSRNHLNASRFFQQYWFKNPALLKKKQQKTNTPWRKITWLLDSYDPSAYSLVDISKKKIPLQLLFRTSNFNPALQWTDMFWWILKPQSRYNWWKYLVTIFSFYLFYVLIHFKSSTSEKVIICLKFYGSLVFEGIIHNSETPIKEYHSVIFMFVSNILSLKILQHISIALLTTLFFNQLYKYFLPYLNNLTITSRCNYTKSDWRTVAPKLRWMYVDLQFR